MPGAVDPTGKLKSWVWEVSEMIVSDFRLCHFCGGFKTWEDPFCNPPPAHLHATLTECSHIRRSPRG